MISIIVPVYNKEKYIDNLVNQLRTQTYKDFEVIFIDDGSSDNSYEIALKYANNHNNVYVYTQKNLGVSVARNKGIEKSHGEWLAFLDPDDSVADNYLEELINHVAKDTDIISCCCYAYDDNGKYLNEFYSDNRIFEGENKVELFRQLLNDNYDRSGIVHTAIGVPWGKLYKKIFITNNGLQFNSKLKRQQDNIFNMHAFNKAKKIKYLNKPLYYYQIDNIKKYYQSKFDKYALKNAEELQKERYTFFVKENNYNDSKTREILYDETVSVLIGSFNKFLLNKQNDYSFNEKKKEFNRLIKTEYFGEIIQKLRVSDINGFIHKLVALSLKYQFFYSIYFIWKFRGMYEKIKFN